SMGVLCILSAPVSSRLGQGRTITRSRRRRRCYSGSHFGPYCVAASWFRDATATESPNFCPRHAMCSRFGLATAGAATFCVGLLLSGMTAAAAPLGMAQPIDCDAVNRGHLNVELSGSAYTTRAVTLAAGETLDIIFDAASNVSGSLNLVGGVGSPRHLLSGPAGSAVTFVAQVPDTFAFEFAAEGEAASSFVVTCTSAGDSQEPNDQQSARYGADEVASDALDLWLPADPQALIMELKARDAARDTTLSSSRTPKPVHGRTTIRTPDGLDLWLGAKGQRYSLNAPTEPPPNADAS